MRRPNLGAEDIADSAHGVQQLGLERLVDLLAQPADEHVDDVRLRIEVVLPHVREDHRLRDDTAGVAHQVFEERELARADVDDLAGARHAPRQQIEDQVRDGQRRRLRRAGSAAHERLHAREQLGERERLGEVIVAAGLQAADAIVDRAPRAQNEHRRRHAAPPQLFDERQAVALRQHQVDDCGVVRLIERRDQARSAIREMVDGEPGFAQSARDELGDGRVVFDEQSTHDRIIPMAPGSTKISKHGNGCFVAPTARRYRGGAPCGAARRYCGGHGTVCPSSRAARSGKYGSRSSSRAMSTQSALPLATISCACAASVIRPTAPVGMPASRRTRSANGTWYPGPSGIFASATPPPDEQSIRSAPRAFSRRASSTVCSMSHPPSFQSVHESRTESGSRSGHTVRTASTTSRQNRRRPSYGPPYSSVRVLMSGERNSWIRYPCAAWISTTSNPACSARSAAVRNAATTAPMSFADSRHGTG